MGHSFHLLNCVEQWLKFCCWHGVFCILVSDKRQHSLLCCLFHVTLEMDVKENSHLIFDA